jgi:hypothetical protein
LQLKVESEGVLQVGGSIKRNTAILGLSQYRLGVKARGRAKLRAWGSEGISRRRGGGVAGKVGVEANAASEGGGGSNDGAIRGASRGRDMSKTIL